MGRNRQQPPAYKEVIALTPVVWLALGLAGVAFCVWTGWPLYNIYKTRRQGADVAEGQAYFRAKARAERAQDTTGPAEGARPAAQGTGQPAESDPAATPSRD
jgi:hypothetical protein